MLSAEPEETLENSGLLTVYDNTDTDNAVETVPELDIPATRPREETVPDRKKPRLSLAEEWQQETEDLKKGASPERSRLSEGSSPVRQPAEEPVDILKRMGGSPKVNSSPAPSKNKFAIGSNSAKKNRFSLNAKKDSSVGVVKEVKSRLVLSLCRDLYSLIMQLMYYIVVDIRILIHMVILVCEVNTNFLF